MQSLFQTGQLDLTQISGLLTNVLVTGQVLRPLETVPFLTDDYLESTGNFINTYNVNLSGSIVETGQFILNEYLTGGLAGTLNLTGQSLLARDNLLSGTFNLS